MIQVKHGEILGKVSGGGGGVGDPLERDPAAVLRDVTNEVVTIEAARETYGVVIASAEAGVDAGATRALRASRHNGHAANVPAADLSGVE
jgi:N-methylhydantoinase B